MFRERALTAALIIPTTIVVVTLAVVQYRWSNEVSAATSLRLADSLQMSMTNWDLNLFRDLSDVCLSLQVDSVRIGVEDLDQHVRRFRDWQASAPYPDLVAHVYILPDGDRTLLALSVNSSTTRFEAVPRPSRFDGLWGDLRPDAVPIAREASTTGIEYAAAGLRGWRFEPSIPALLRPVTTRGIFFADSTGAQLEVPAWLVVELDANVIRNRVLPDLAKRYFTGVGGLDYEVALVSGSHPRRILYSSEPDFAVEDPIDADGRLNVFGRSVGQTDGSSWYVFHATSEAAAPPAGFATTWLPLLRQTPSTLTTGS